MTPHSVLSALSSVYSQRWLRVSLLGKSKRPSFVDLHEMLSFHFYVRSVVLLMEHSFSRPFIVPHMVYIGVVHGHPYDLPRFVPIGLVNDRYWPSPTSRLKTSHNWVLHDYVQQFSSTSFQKMWWRVLSLMISVSIHQFLILLPHRTGHPLTHTFLPVEDRSPEVSLIY